MRQTAKVFFLVGVFLVVSVLWPYDPTTDTSDAARAPRPFFAFAAYDPPEFLIFEDRWGGETQKFVAETNFTVLPTQVTSFELPSRKTILPGTEYLVFTHSVTAMDGTPSDVQMRFAAANGEGWTVPVTGEVTKIRIREHMADWAPDPDSRWTFSLTTDKGPIEVQRFRLEIVRFEGKLPEVVEYDDRWDGERMRRVFHESGLLRDARVMANDPASEANRAGLPVPNVDTGSTPDDAPVLENVPPRDVDEMRVVLTYNSSTPTYLHYRPTLFFRGANLDTDEWAERGMPPTRSDPREQNGRFEWRLPIDPEMWDSPFQADTRWTVILNWRGDSTDLPVYMNGDYKFYVDVYRAPGT